MMNEMMLCVAPNGARLKKQDHPALPISPDELALCAEECASAGAAMIHLHVRDENGAHILDAHKYDDAVRAIRDRMGDKIVIQVTTEAVGRYQADEQRDLVQTLKPEAVSLGLRELLPEDGDEQVFAQFYNWMEKEAIWPQIILYDEFDIQHFLDLRMRGIFGQGHVSVLCVLGRYGKGFGKPRDLIPLYQLLEGQNQLDWSLCAFGPQENACISMAAALGGHGRIGFENNTLLVDGTKAADNAALVSQAAQSAHLCGRKIMDGPRLRELRVRQS